MSLAAILGTPDRVAFSLFGFDIMWYSLCIVAGIISGACLAYARSPRYGIDGERWIDIVIYCVPAAIIGSRIYYVAFKWDYYSENLSEILNIRSGGLAIHGALIFGVATGLFVERKHRHETFKMLDLVAPALAIGQAIGRWGNYFNQEAHGSHTDLPWAILIDGDTVHPTFLYESLWCLFICIFLLRLEKTGRKKFDGELMLLYVLLYSAERFFVEGLRTDSLMIGSFRQAQVISVFAIAAVFIIWKPYKKLSLKMASEGAAPDLLSGSASAAENTEESEEGGAE